MLNEKSCWKMEENKMKYVCQIILAIKKQKELQEKLNKLEQKWKQTKYII